MAESPTKTALRTFSAASAPGDPDSLDAIKGHAPTVVITRLTPSIDGGRYQLKRLPWEILAVEADIFRDGHDILTARLLSRRKGESSWTETMMVQGDSDRWYASCAFPEHGLYQYTIQAWSELWLSWCHDFGKKHDAGMDDLATEILEGSLLVVAAARRAGEADHRDQAGALLAAGETLRASATPTAAAAAIESEKLHALMEVWSDRSLATTAEAPHEVWVDRERAGFSSWYEFFPRGAEGRGDKHSTLRDCVPRLEAASAMGFDVIYFPPIHPIGITARKGADNALEAGPGDPGSPWAIGGSAGGHRSVEPALGTLEDFVWLLGQARERGLEIALDFAINCSPDHPYVREHPEWFFQRPDGSIKYAENPPKKYQDIYPLDFHCADWRNLWREMLELVLFWVDQGVLIFRVDNPHTKPFAFWEYLIAEVRAVAPDTLFFAEAFTRPKLMQMLGKIGFSMSYTYFTWRHSREDFVDYLTELTNSEMADYFRANFWPNTPDILAVPLRGRGPAAFEMRAVLAAMLSPNWGIYSGYELCENEPASEENEEYLHSEKFQLVERDWNGPGNIKDFITRLNKIRREHPALQEYKNIRFCPTTNGAVLAWTKTTTGGANRILTVVNLDPEHPQETMVEVPLESLGLDENRPFAVHDLLDGATYEWSGRSNYVALDPVTRVAHIFLIEG